MSRLVTAVLLTQEAGGEARAERMGESWSRYAHTQFHQGGARGFHVSSSLMRARGQGRMAPCMHPDRHRTLCGQKSRCSASSAAAAHCSAPFLCLPWRACYRAQRSNAKED